MSRSVLGFLPCLAVCLVLAGCTDDSEPTDPIAGPVAPSELPSSGGVADGAYSCATVTAEALSEATGTSQSVLGPVFDAPLPSCRTAFDGRGMTLEWDFGADPSAFAQLGVEAELPGLDRRRITIGSQPAWLLQGRVVDTDTALVVLLLDDVQLSVDANTAGDPGATVTMRQLRAGAEAVASIYLG